MSTIDLLNSEGAKTGTVDLPADLFDITTNVPLIHQVVTAQLAAGRQGTHATKTRGLVRGGGIKPWRQKGTGRARQGSRRAPQWVGGGTVFGPQPRSYAQKTPKRMIQAALLGALSDRAREGRIFVFDTIVEGDMPSTRQASAALASLSEYRNILAILDRDDFVGWLSLRNLPNVQVIAADQLNAYDIVVADAVVFTQAAVEVFAAAKGSAVKVKIDKKPAKAEKSDKDEAEEVVKPARKPAAKKTAEVVDEAKDEAEEVVKPARKTAAKKTEAVEAVDEAKVEEVVKPARKPAAKKTAEVVDEVKGEVEEVVKPAKKPAAKKAAEPVEAEAEVAAVKAPRKVAAKKVAEAKAEAEEEAK